MEKNGMGHNEGSGGELCDELEAIRGQLEERAARVRESVTAFVDEHPLAAVALAFGAGYVIAGGLVSRATGKLLKMGAKLGLSMMLRQAVLAMPGLLMHEHRHEEASTH